MGCSFFYVISPLFRILHYSCHTTIQKYIILAHLNVQVTCTFRCNNHPANRDYSNKKGE